MNYLQRQISPGSALYDKLKLAITEQKHTYFSAALSTPEFMVFISANKPDWFKDKGKLEKDYRIAVTYEKSVANVTMTPKVLEDSPIDKLQKVFKDAIDKVKAKLPAGTQLNRNETSSSGQSDVHERQQDGDRTEIPTTNLPES